ncbi:hypothetical protein NQ107_26675, partial [Escherichia coli]|nr:hypothetical protein [Escherichia coli]
RLRYQEMPISASRVRQLLAKNDLTAIAPLVPAVTLHYLINFEILIFGEPVCL